MAEPYRHGGALPAWRSPTGQIAEPSEIRERGFLFLVESDRFERRRADQGLSKASKAGFSAPSTTKIMLEFS